MRRRACQVVGPVGHGKVTCVSIFSGPDVDYGDGPGKALWIDNLDDADGVLQEFKVSHETALQNSFVPIEANPPPP